MDIINTYRDRIKKAPLEGKIFIIAISMGFAISFVNIFVNIVLDLHISTIIITSIMAIFCFIMFIVAVHTTSYANIGFVTFLFFIFVFYPFLWFTNGGVEGPTLSVYIFNIALCAIIFDTKRTRILLLCELIAVVTLIGVEYSVPNMVIGYENQLSKIIDNGASTNMLIVAIFFLARNITDEYHKAINKLEATQEELKNLAITDPLSGIFNRRHIMEQIKQLLTENKSFSLIMMDIDNFKSINDNYGHTIGDDVIKTVATMLNVEARSDDFAGRIGGEEFMIIAVETNYQDACQLAETIRKKTESQAWPNESLHVTISGGVYTKNKEDDYESLLEKVDHLLYDAKHKGKNIIV